MKHSAVFFVFLALSICCSAQSQTDSISQVDSILWEQTLGEVVIKANRIQNKVNGYVVNLQGDNIVKGKDAEGVLKFLPRVEYVDGAFRIDGQAVTEVYLNGVRLNDLSQLRNIMGENLTTVEVEYIGGVNQKSAEMGGVIRINMKKPENGGYYGTFRGSHESMPSDLWGSNSLGGMAYWGNKKWGLYANGSIGRDSYIDKGTDQVGPSADDIQSLTATWQKNKSLYVRGNVQMMYQPNARHAFTTKIYAHRNISNGNTRLANLLTSTPTIDNNHWDGNITQTNVLAQYTCKIDSVGGLLTASAEYYHAYSNDGNVFDTFQYGTNIENTYNIAKVKIDLSKPLNRSLQLQAGGSFDYDDLAYRDKTLSSRRQASVRGDADIRISAPLLYITLAGRYKKWMYTLGTNYQMHSIHYNDLASRQVSKNRHGSLNPQGSLAYALNPQNGTMLRLDYAHQTGDVPYGNINANTEWLSDHLYLTGNPNLRPWKQDRLLLALSMLNNRVTLIGGYNNGKDFSKYITEEDAQQSGIYVTHPVNTDNHDVTLVAGAAVNLKPLKWWRVNLMTSLSWDKLNNTVGGIDYEGWKNRWQISTNQNFNLSETSQLSLFGQYETRTYLYGVTWYRVYQLNASYSKQLSKHWDVSLEGTALRRPRSWAEYSASAYRYHHTTRDDRYIQLTLTYKFARGKSVSHQQANSIISVDGDTRNR